MYVAVVDDQESSLAGFAQILRRLPDVEPICFQQAGEALHWLAGVDPVFIVVDYMLAGIDGLDFVRRARLLAGRKNTPVIMTCQSPSREVRRAAFDLDVHAFLDKPINPTEFVAHASHIVQPLRERAELEARFVEVSKRARLARPAIASRDATIDLMMRVAALHDPTLVAHHHVAAQFAVAIAREIKLNDEEIEALTEAARIYDVGKVAIPQRILGLRTPAGPADRVTIEEHAEAGARLLGEHDDPVLRSAALIALTHHERWDGQGYPRKLRGPAIPIFGRIVAIADTLAGLLRPRGDRPAHSLSQAIEVVAQQAGGAFDPAVVGATRRALTDISRIAHEALVALQ